jgi:hypothetical protein
MTMIRAWHFIAGGRLRDGTTAPKDGKWLKFDGKPILCEQGLHASIDAFDALSFAPGETLCLVDCAGTVLHGNDKIVCTERRIVVRMDATPLLRYLARQQALSVLHLYPGEPAQCVLDFLMGDDEAREAAWSAARSAESATRSEAWAAVWAARAAAWSAVRSAAWSEVWSAAWSEAWSEAWSALRADFNALVADAFEDWL